MRQWTVNNYTAGTTPSTQTIYFDDAVISSTPSSGGSPTPVPTSLKLKPVADTYVNSASPSTNYGRATSLGADASPVQLSYLKFDLTSLAGKTVSSAKLRLYVLQGATGEFKLSSVGTGWNETALTYNQRPALGTYIGSWTSPVDGTWIEYNVTSQVQSRLGRRVAFALSTSSTGAFWTNSREQTDSNKPQLVIK